MQSPQQELQADESRRRLLEESDRVLEQVEQLRLAEARAVPQSLRSAIAVLQARLGRQDPPLPPATLRAAHSMVFAVQQRLMAANPRNPGTRAHPGRAAGAPRVQPVRPGATWKVLTLPPRPPAGDPDLWLELADATVERSLERWAYAQFHAVRAARENGQAGVELALARVAWANYYELRCEAERLRLSLRGRRPAEPEARRP
jgi:hypothetical protein